MINWICPKIPGWKGELWRTGKQYKCLDCKYKVKIYSNGVECELRNRLQKYKDEEVIK